MDEAKRMEEGLRSTPQNGNHKDDDMKQETKKSNGGGDSIEHDREVGESVEQTVEPEQPVVKQKTQRVATLDVFRGLTIVVSVFN